MSGPTVKTSKSGDTRYYHHPDTDVRAVGVTSVLSNLPKDFLKFWASKVVAEHAVDNLGTLIPMVMSDSPSARGDAVDWLKRAPMRNTSDAATRGTRVHNWTEQIDELGTMPKRVPADILPYMRGYLEFRSQTECEIVHAERTVWSDEMNVAGTFDRIVKIPESAFAGFDAPPTWFDPDLPIMADIKTTRSGVFPDVAMQIAAYRACSHILIPDEHGVYDTVQMIKTQPHGIVIHLRPDSWKAVPVLADDSVLDTFKALLVVHAWQKTGSKKVLLQPFAGSETTESDVVALQTLLDAL